MGSMMKNMTIGPKFILSISAVALAGDHGRPGGPVPTGRGQDGHNAEGAEQRHQHADHDRPGLYHAELCGQD